eukprot:scaffold4498_cov119-Isochrysis_galbana.AAC.8
MPVRLHPRDERPARAQLHHDVNDVPLGVLKILKEPHYIWVVERLLDIDLAAELFDRAPAQRIERDRLHRKELA